MKTKASSKRFNSSTRSSRFRGQEALWSVLRIWCQIFTCDINRTSTCTSVKSKDATPIACPTPIACQKITLKGEKSYREKLTEKRTGLKREGGLM